MTREKGKMDTNTLIGLVGAFGLGSVVTAGVTHWLNIQEEKKSRRFEERKETYIGFFDALHKSEIEQTHIASLNVGYWRNRIELVGSTEVIKLCYKIEETNPKNGLIHPERPQVILDLKNAMRKDLGIDRTLIAK
jgi:hypothetical protein